MFFKVIISFILLMNIMNDIDNSENMLEISHSLSRLILVSLTNNTIYAFLSLMIQ